LQLKLGKKGVDTGWDYEKKKKLRLGCQCGTNVEKGRKACWLGGEGLKGKESQIRSKSLIKKGGGETRIMRGRCEAKEKGLYFGWGSHRIRKTFRKKCLGGKKGGDPDNTKKETNYS